MEAIPLFNSVIDEQISRLETMRNVQFDISVLQDLKRMAELGCFTVYTAAPNDFEIKFGKEDGRCEIRCTVPRMMWTGEETISRLQMENKLLREELESLKS